jgi:hypothetical protein
MRKNFAFMVIGAGIVETVASINPQYVPSPSLGICALIVGALYLWVN